MTTHVYNHDNHSHSVMSSEQRGYFLSRMAREFAGMLAGAGIVFIAVVAYSAVGVLVSAGIALVGATLFVRSTLQRMEDYMDVNDLYSADQ